MHGNYNLQNIQIRGAFIFSCINSSFIYLNKGRIFCEQESVYFQMQKTMKEPSWINGSRLLYYSERRNLFGPRYYIPLNTNPLFNIFKKGLLMWIYFLYNRIFIITKYFLFKDESSTYTKLEMISYKYCLFNANALEKK